MSDAAIRKDLERRMEEKMHQWVKDCGMLYEVADIQPTLFMSQLSFLCLDMFLKTMATTNMSRAECEAMVGEFFDRRKEQWGEMVLQEKRKRKGRRAE